MNVRLRRIEVRHGMKGRWRFSSRHDMHNARRRYQLQAHPRFAREPARLSLLLTPPAAFTSFSRSPSSVLAPSISSRSSAEVRDIAIPFEPPISGLLRRSTSVGFFSFGCFVVIAPRLHLPFPAGSWL